MYGSHLPIKSPSFKNEAFPKVIEREQLRFSIGFGSGSGATKMNFVKILSSPDFL